MPRRPPQAPRRQLYPTSLNNLCSMTAFFSSPATRLLFFFVFGVCALAGPVWAAYLFGIVYLLLYRGIEIIAIAFLVDAFYGYYQPYPYVYTLSSTLLLLLTIGVEKYLTVFNYDTHVS